MTNCPNCGSDHIDRDAIDIGVGTQYGPWGCFDCGWTEGQPVDAEVLAATIPEDEDPDDGDRDKLPPGV